MDRSEKKIALFVGALVVLALLAIACLGSTLWMMQAGDAGNGPTDWPRPRDAGPPIRPVDAWTPHMPTGHVPLDLPCDARRNENDPWPWASPQFALTEESLIGLRCREYRAPELRLDTLSGVCVGRTDAESLRAGSARILHERLHDVLGADWRVGHLAVRRDDRDWELGAVLERTNNDAICRERGPAPSPTAGVRVVLVLLKLLDLGDSIRVRAQYSAVVWRNANGLFNRCVPFPTQHRENASSAEEHAIAQAVQLMNEVATAAVRSSSACGGAPALAPGSAGETSDAP